ncbi:MAG TPA: hypothetical protein ENL17_01285 [Candidatus Methanoperedenaceae archaeon]|nr:hypothetical protein [Candidatus Methanoperedenaceae archaeon]
MPKASHMIRPGHCREVSVKTAVFPLEEKDIKEHLLGSRCYTGTRFIVLCNSKDTAVVEVEKTSTGKIFEEIISLRVVSLPEQTVFVEDSGVDVINPSAMLHKAGEYQEDAVVVKGTFGHVSFIRGGESVRLHVFDIVPPMPAKLVSMVERALEMQEATDTPVEVVPEITNLLVIARDAPTENVIFPCSASEIRSSAIPGKDVFFLDKLRTPPENPTLIGCNTSLQIFREMFDCTPEFVQICPREKRSEELFVTKCCELKEGFEMVDGGVVVPWGAELRDVLAAVDTLLGGSS